MKNRISKGLNLFVIIFIIICLSGCGKGKKETELSSKTVSVMQVKPEQYDEKFTYQGKVQAREAKIYSFSVSGKVSNVYVKEGQFVSKGTLLAKLNNTALELKAQQAENNLKSAYEGADKTREEYENNIAALNSSVQSLNNEIDANKETLELMKSNVETARKNAENLKAKMEQSKINFDRVNEIFVVGGVPKIELENAESEYNDAKLAYESALAAVNEAESNIIVKGKEIDSLENSLKTKENDIIAMQKQMTADMKIQAINKSNSSIDTANANKNVEDMVLTADCDGYITKISIKEGENISAGVEAITLKSESSIVTIGVSADDFTKLSAVKNVIINDCINGKVDNISMYPDESTNTYKVDVLFNSNEVISGEIVTVDLITGSREGIFVPIDSVININGVNYVYQLNDDNTVTRINIDIDKIENGRMLVKNLSNQKIVVSGIQTLNDNDLVKVIK